MLEIPQAIIDRFPAAVERSKATPVIMGEVDTPEAIERARLYLVDHAPESYSGQQSEITYIVACRVKDMGVSAETCLDLMMEHWNEAKSHPPLGPDDMMYRIENAYQYGRDPIGVNNPAAQFEVVNIEVEPPTPEEKARTRLFWRSFTESTERGLKDDFQALIGGYLERRAMSVLYGDSGAGKTFVALDFAYHVATGRPWNGRKVTAGPVVYVAAEAGESVNARIAALAKHYQPDKEPPLAVVPCLVNLFTAGADLRELIDLCQRWAEECGDKVALIVLDTLARIIGNGDENSARDMGILVQNIDRLRVATGAHVMVVHHSGKNKANGARGSSALRAATDTELEVEGGRLKMRKQRATEEAKDVTFRLKPVTLGKNAAGETVTSCVIEAGASVDFEIQLTPEQEGWVDQLRAYEAQWQEDTFRPGRYQFTIKDLIRVWGLKDGVQDPVRTTQRRAQVLVEHPVIRVVSASAGKEKVFEII